MGGASAGRLGSPPLAVPKERPDASRENDQLATAAGIRAFLPSIARAGSPNGRGHDVFALCIHGCRELRRSSRVELLTGSGKPWADGWIGSDPLDVSGDPFCPARRQISRAENTAQAFKGKRWIPLLDRRRQLRHGGRALEIGDGQELHLAGLELRFYDRDARP